ncbi:MAG TPA: HEAT repeat domain-containing protein [Planctomycetota bacterium]|jgi:HEAT repeat protein
MKKLMVLSLTVVFLATAAFAGQPDEKTQTNGNEMSLQLYQKLKQHFDALYGAQMPLLPGVQPVSRADTEKALRTDASEAKAELIKALGSSSAIHRELSARALEYCGDKKAAVEALIKIVNSDTDEGVRRAAAAGLAKMPDASASEALMKGLSDSADAVRSSCANGLGNIKDPRACEPLLKILASDLKPMVRMLAANALSKIKEKSSLEALGKALETEKDERVKMAIAGAVRSIMGSDTAKTEPIPTAGEAANALSDLSKEMKEVEQKLREDRHDQAVQVQGQGIEQKLSALIQKLDKG